MSSSDRPEPGVPDPTAHELGAMTSPQGTQQPSGAEQPSTVPDNSIPVVDSSASAVPSDHVQSEDVVAANHPATGGESAAPVTATTSSISTATTTPPNDTTSAVAQPQKPDAPSMDTDEPKTGAELSEVVSEDVEGKEAEDAGPSLVITLLLTTGTRHPFTIDGKYLRKRSVNVENYDPFAMSVYTLKELIWREWRSGKCIHGERWIREGIGSRS